MSNNSLAPAGCPVIQLNSDTFYLELVWTPQIKGSNSQDCSYFRHQHKPWIATRTLDQLALNRGSHESFLGFDDLIEWFTEFRKILSYIYWLITKDIIKDIDELPDEEIHKVRSRRVLSTGASVPVELRWATLLACICIHWPRSSPNLLLWGFLRTLHHVGRKHDGLNV